MSGHWAPSAPVANLRRRARLTAAVRRFFADRGVEEVHPPCLSAATVTDPALQGLAVSGDVPGAPDGARLWLQTSPEYAMKRLLAAGMGPIYAITPAFRAAERGRLHNPEFTLLEWYRPGFDHHRLTDEVTALVTEIAGQRPVRRYTYANAFRDALAVDPLSADTAELRALARRELSGLDATALDRDGVLDALLGIRVIPALGRGEITVLTDYPASQAALARLSPEDPRVAERFEVFVDGMEIANGFHELADPTEQRARFEEDRTRRAAAGLPVPAVDERLLAALEAGLPDCAGVALGLDRLFMVALGAERIDEVMAFPVERA
ncbi:EF-P lysine aminoacylase EpmA [Arhodomonas sp. SL1]|uniref:EF-P lysine aminoacylase EpmA n=1 Tax=Arhodomonas sp. SL1 TaxID=3425691 RepID=UPI003F880C1F